MIAGLDVEQLAATHTFEQAATRVLGFEVDTRAARTAAWELLPRLGDALDHPDGMDALRTGLAHLRATGDDRADALTAIGAAPVFVAAWNRRRTGQSPIAPDPAMGHAANFLYLLTGERPNATAIRALDVALVVVLERVPGLDTHAGRPRARRGRGAGTG